jgi:preprotein translocase subunit SecG
MIGFLILLLTLLMVLDCVVLVFLVLIQLPKKEAGAGLAFGGSATDALFGAGSGTVLTKITKYAAITFFGLAVFLSILQENYARRSTSNFATKLSQPGRAPTLPATTPPAPETAPATPAQSSNAPFITTPPALTNLPTAPANLAPEQTNAPPAQK